MPRAGLTPQRVVEQAEALADDVGLDNLTLTLLAQTLGVRQPSLYKHIGGLGELRRMIAVRAKQDLADALARAAVGKSRDDAIGALAGEYRAWARNHPGRYAATLRAPDPGDADDVAASEAAVGVVLDVLVGYRLTGDAAVDATRALRSALHGFVSLEAAGGFGLPRGLDASYSALVAGYIAGLPAMTADAGEPLARRLT